MRFSISKKSWPYSVSLIQSLSWNHRFRLQRYKNYLECANYLSFFVKSQYFPNPKICIFRINALRLHRKSKSRSLWKQKCWKPSIIWLRDIRHTRVRCHRGKRRDFRNGFTPFMWMNRREEELVNLMVFIGGVSAFGLLATDDPKSTFFGFFKRVHMVLKTVNESASEDDFDAHRRRSFAPMHNLRAQGIFETEKVLVQNRMNLAILRGSNRYFGYFNSHFLKSRNNIYILYIIGCTMIRYR